MTMPTIIERQRHTHRVNGRFAKRQGEARARYQASRDDDLDAALLAELQGSYDDTRIPTPPQPWSEPVERETWQRFPAWVNWLAFAAIVPLAFGLAVWVVG